MVSVVMRGNPTDGDELASVHRRVWEKGHSPRHVDIRSADMVADGPLPAWPILLVECVARQLRGIRVRGSVELLSTVVPTERRWAEYVQAAESNCHIVGVKRDTQGLGEELSGG
eukprot:gene2438-biopygen7095